MEPQLKVVFDYYISKGGLIKDPALFVRYLSDWLFLIGGSFSEVHIFVQNELNKS